MRQAPEGRGASGTTFDTPGGSAASASVSTLSISATSARLARSVAAHSLAHGLKRAIFGGERRIGRQILLEGERVGGVEFAVEGGVEPEVLGSGAGSIMVSGFHDLVSAPRARARRDMTVPIGRPAASAMSR